MDRTVAPFGDCDSNRRVPAQALSVAVDYDDEAAEAACVTAD